MANIIDFTKNGGYRFKQFTLRKMQESTFETLKAFIAFAQIPETGNFIIAGCTIVGANITDGYLYIDGELCKFTETAGDLTSKIKKNVVIQALGFKNGNNENVFRFTNAVIDASGTTLSAFTRVSPVFDANYVHTDNNYSYGAATKLAGIQAGAQVNVQADWNASVGSPAQILNKPTIEDTILFTGTVLSDGTKGSYYKRNFTSELLPDARYKITHNLGFANYAVVGAGLVDGFIKIGAQSRGINEVIVVASDDSSPNYADFSFIVFKV